jgi:hypothetical protein
LGALAVAQGSGGNEINYFGYKKLGILGDDGNGEFGIQSCVSKSNYPNVFLSV